MKKILNAALLICGFLSATAQDFQGLNTGNYAGVNGLLLQPANVADNRYRFDFNLASTNFGFQNNYLGFTRNYFVQERFSLNDFKNFQDFRDNVLTANPLPAGEKGYFNLQNRVMLPGTFMITGKKGGLALTLQSRTSFAFANVDGNLMNQIYRVWGNSATYNTAYNNDGLSLNAMNWFEGGLTYGRVLVNKNKHFLKFGITGKYLGGLSSVYFNADKLSVSATNKDSMSVNASNIAYGHSATNVTGRINSSWRPDATGFGGDIGFVYEFRGRINRYKFLKGSGDETVQTLRRDKNKYTFKVGASLLDVGQLQFTSVLPGSNLNYNGILNVGNLGVNNVQGFDSLVAKNATYTGTANPTYTIAMPTALSVQFDLHLIKGFYINAMTYRPFTKLNENATFRTYTPNFYVVTPRFETRALGLYVPLTSTSINNIKDRNFTIGTTLRVGPLFVGTANLPTLLKRDNIKSADIHAGLKLPIAYGKPSKASKWLKKIANDDDNDNTSINNERTVVVEGNATTNNGESTAALAARLAALEEALAEKEAQIERLERQVLEAEEANSNLTDAEKAARAAVRAAEEAAEEAANGDDSPAKVYTERLEIINEENSQPSNDNKPVQITINNYGAGTSATQSTDGGADLNNLNDQIEYLR
jgi:hypothetical protein